MLRINRALLFTDFHLMKDLLPKQKKLLKEIVKIAVQEKLKYIIFLGDMFNDRKSITVYELLTFLYFLRLLKQNEILFIAISGNHDKPYDEAEKSYLGIFKNMEAKIFEKKRFYRIGNLGFVPYFSEKIIFDLIKNYKNKNKIEYLFLHTSFNGVQTNNGWKVDKSLLNIKIFENFKNLKKVFVGHYHKQQEIFNGLIEYIGNPYQINYGEDENKNVYIVDFEKNKKIKRKLNYEKYKTFLLKCNTEDYLRAKKIITTEEQNNVRLFFYDKKEKLSSIPEEEFFNISKCKSLKIEKDFEDDNIFESKNIVIENEKNLLKNFFEYSKKEKMTSEERLFGIKILQKYFKRNIINE